MDEIEVLKKQIELQKEVMNIQIVRISNLTTNVDFLTAQLELIKKEKQTEQTEAE